MAEQETVEERLHRMRDELADLSNKLTEARRYSDAHKLLGCIMLLDDCSDLDDFHEIAWPAQVEIENDGFRTLRRVERDD